MGSTPGEKVVLLTFDDGPDPECTPDVLATLKANRIHALFFVIGQQAAVHPELLRQITAGGHVLGNHTFTHETILGREDAWLEQQVLRTEQVITEATGRKSFYFRPPRGKYGFQEARLLGQLGQTVLLWDYGLEKDSIRDPEALVTHLMRRIRPEQNKLVLLLHDGDPRGQHSRRSTVKALPKLIAALKAHGYTFVDPSTPEGRAFIADFSAAHPKIDEY